MKINEEFNQPYIQLRTKSKAPKEERIENESEYYGSRKERKEPKKEKERTSENERINESEIVQKGKLTYPEEQSPYLAVRGNLEKGTVSAPKDQSSLLAERGKPEKSKVTYKDSRYK